MNYPSSLGEHDIHHRRPIGVIAQSPVNPAGLSDVTLLNEGTFGLSLCSIVRQTMCMITLNVLQELLIECEETHDAFVSCLCVSEDVKW